MRLGRGHLPIPALLLLAMLTACGDLTMQGVRGEPPTAVMDVSPANGPVPLDVTVDSSASGYAELRAVQRELAIDDGPFRTIEEFHTLTIDTPGEYELTLRVTGSGGATATTTARVTALPGTASESGFRMQVVHVGNNSGEREHRAFEEAARRWSEVVVGDLPDVTLQPGLVEQACGSEYRFSGVVDDLLLFAHVRPMDGAGGVVGMAGACLLRANGFPAVGIIVIDSADVDFLAATGNLSTVVLHELGHVIDLNHASWSRLGLLYHDRSDCLQSSIVDFTGQRAAQEYSRLGGSGAVPVENNGVGGTACSHWDEETFRSELMTGYLDGGASLSRLTVAALADAGYRVNMEAADPYQLPDPGTLRTQSRGQMVSERLIPVGGIVAEDGSFTPTGGGEVIELDLELR